MRLVDVANRYAVIAHNRESESAFVVAWFVSFHDAEMFVSEHWRDNHLYTVTIVEREV